MIRNRMTCDGMMFFRCLKPCGIDETGRIGKAAVRPFEAVGFFLP